MTTYWGQVTFSGDKGQKICKLETGVLTERMTTYWGQVILSILIMEIATYLKQLGADKVYIQQLIYTFVLVSLVFIPLERLFANRRDQKILRAGWTTDIIHVVFTGAIIQITNVMVIVMISLTIQTNLPESFRYFVNGQPIWMQYLEVIIIADLGFYAMHRAFHEIPWLWKLHAVHHSSEKLDYLASYRVHPIDQFMVRSITLIPVFSMGFHIEVLQLFSLVYHWQAMLIHSNTRFRFGWLEFLIATPCFHHWHHSDDTIKGRNFAGQLAIIDRFFGTFEIPGNKMPTSYGIQEEMPDNYVEQLTIPFKRGPKE